MYEKRKEENNPEIVLAIKMFLKNSTIRTNLLCVLTIENIVNIVNREPGEIRESSTTGIT